jgi:Family of unknown function (DUF6328)
MADKQQTLAECIAEVPFGRQKTAVLADRFDRLGAASQTVYLTSLELIAIAIVLLIAPVAYHRMVGGGDPNDTVRNYIVRMMMVAV